MLVVCGIVFVGYLVALVGGVVHTLFTTHADERSDEVFHRDEGYWRLR